MPNLTLADLSAEIEANVRRALTEDIGSGDITAQLIPEERLAYATVITREAAVIAGTAWVDVVFRQLDPRVAVHWQVADGDRVQPNQPLFHRRPGAGIAQRRTQRTELPPMPLRRRHPRRSLCGAGERHLGEAAGHPQDPARPAPCAEVRRHLRRGPQPSDRPVRRLPDQGKPHRRLRRNHPGHQRRPPHRPGKPVEVEVENLDELRQALDAGADIIMLDELSLDDMRTAVTLTAGRAKLEASGGINDTTLRTIAETGVDYISIGTLTKDVRAVDLSMRLSL